MKRLAPITLCLLLFSMQPAFGQESFVLQLQGSWVANDELSDNTDDAVEDAIKRGGGSVRRSWFRRRPEDFYRGGPEEQEMYDRVSYDDVLSISYDEPEFRFQYADDYVRVFYSDGRRRRTSANDFFAGGGEDYSLANFEGQSLLVEGRPRDGGFTLERYTLENAGSRLRIEMTIHPDSFREPIELVRVFDRVQ